MQFLELLLDLIGLLLNLLVERPERRRALPSAPSRDPQPLAGMRPLAAMQSPSALSTFLGKGVCESCLWRASNTCTAPDSPVSGQRCEPVCSGRVVCEAMLQLGTDDMPSIDRPSDARELVREGLLACPRCGSEYQSGSVFCQTCGAAVLAV